MAALRDRRKMDKTITIEREYVKLYFFDVILRHNTI